jgi:hypothetical protein
MKTSTRTAILATVGVLAVGGLAGTAVAVAAAGPSDRPAATASDPGPGPRHGDGPQWNGGQRGGPGGHGRGPGAGDCEGLAVTAPKGELTAAQRSTLAAMAEEEKLAHDLYAAFGDKYQVPIFDRIATSETRHLDVVRTLLDRYGVSDPTAGKAAGSFASDEAQATYDRLLAEGSKSQDVALNVGQRVERTDIADLRAALEGLTAPDVKQVYGNLIEGSEHHLTAFQRFATR